MRKLVKWLKRTPNKNDLFFVNIREIIQLFANNQKSETPRTDKLARYYECECGCKFNVVEIEDACTLETSRNEWKKVAEKYDKAWDSYRVFPSIANERLFTEAITAYQAQLEKEAVKI